MALLFVFCIFLSCSEPPCIGNSIESIDQNLASSDECDETTEDDDDDDISCDEKLAKMGSMRDWIGVHSVIFNYY